jgi:hypothetical protein
VATFGRTTVDGVLNGDLQFLNQGYGLTAFPDYGGFDGDPVNGSAFIFLVKLGGGSPGPNLAGYRSQQGDRLRWLRLSRYLVQQRGLASLFRITRPDFGRNSDRLRVCSKCAESHCSARSGIRDRDGPHRKRDISFRDARLGHVLRQAAVKQRLARTCSFD